MSEDSTDDAGSEHAQVREASAREASDFAKRAARMSDEAYRRDVASRGHWYDRLLVTGGTEAILESPHPEKKRKITVRRK